MSGNLAEDVSVLSVVVGAKDVDRSASDGVDAAIFGCFIFRAVAGTREVLSANGASRGGSGSYRYTAKDGVGLFCGNAKVAYSTGSKSFVRFCVADATA